MLYGSCSAWEEYKSPKYSDTPRMHDVISCTTTKGRVGAYTT